MNYTWATLTTGLLRLFTITNAATSIPSLPTLEHTCPIEIIPATRTADPSALARRNFEFFTKSTPFYGHATATTMGANILNTMYSDTEEFAWQNRSCCSSSAFNNSSWVDFLKSQKEIQLFGNELNPWMVSITCTSFENWCVYGKSCYCGNGMSLEESNPSPNFTRVEYLFDDEQHSMDIDSNRDASVRNHKTYTSAGRRIRSGPSTLCRILLWMAQGSIATFFVYWWLSCGHLFCWLTADPLDVIGSWILAGIVGMLSMVFLWGIRSAMLPPDLIHERSALAERAQALGVQVPEPDLIH